MRETRAAFVRWASVSGSLLVLDIVTGNHVPSWSLFVAGIMAAFQVVPRYVRLWHAGYSWRDVLARPVAPDAIEARLGDRRPRDLPSPSSDEFGGNTAVVQQLEQGVAFGMPTEAEIALAELLTKQIPSVEQIRFTNSGSEAVMMAIKAARAYTGRPKIAKFEGCYHGSYDFAEAGLATPQELWNAVDPPTTAYSLGTPQSVLENVAVLPFNDLPALERLLGRHRKELAAVLV